MSNGQIALLDFLVFFQVSYASLVFDVTVVHDVSPVRMLQRELHVLFGEEHRHPLLFDQVDKFAQDFDNNGGQSLGRFVEQDEIRDCP